MECTEWQKFMLDVEKRDTNEVLQVCVGKYVKKVTEGQLSAEKVILTMNIWMVNIPVSYTHLRAHET